MSIESLPRARLFQVYSVCYSCNPPPKLVAEGILRLAWSMKKLSVKGIKSSAQSHAAGKGPPGDPWPVLIHTLPDCTERPQWVSEDSVSLSRGHGHKVERGLAVSRWGAVSPLVLGDPDRKPGSFTLEAGELTH